MSRPFLLFIIIILLTFFCVATLLFSTASAYPTGSVDCVRECNGNGNDKGFFCVDNCICSVQQQQNLQNAKTGVDEYDRRNIDIDPMPSCAEYDELEQRLERMKLSERQSESSVRTESAPQPAPPPAAEDCKATAAKLKVGDTVESDVYIYALTQVLGCGGYGAVYKATATCKKGAGTKCNECAKQQQQEVALKVEEKEAQEMLILLEAEVLRAAKAHGCKRIPRIYESGSLKGRPYNFISMELKGRDIQRVRKQMQDSKFSLSTAVRVGLQTLEAIEELHDLGYISRDIKPSNFVIGRAEEDKSGEDLTNVYLIDFGLAKKFKDESGNVLPYKGIVGWCGTNRYRSLMAHQRLDLGRRDDLESWFYTLVEITTGSLPWEPSKDCNSKDTFERKKAVRSNLIILLDECPAEYREIYKLIEVLKFADAPNYARIRELLEQIIATQHIAIDAQMDWEHCNNNTN